MKYPKLAKTLTVAAALLGAVTLTVAPGVAESAIGDDYGEELELRLEEARKQLDEAAKRLAEIHEQSFEKSRQAYGQAYALNFTKRAMLGVLLDGERHDSGGVALVGVTPGSGAADAGLEAGDELLVIGETRLDGEGAHKALGSFMKSVQPGEAVALQYRRDGEVHDAVVITQSHSDHIAYILDDELSNLNENFSIDFNFGDIGLMRQRVLTGKGPLLTDMNEDLGEYFGVDGGVLVLEAPEDCELKSGDVILELDGEAPESARDARRTIARAESDIAAQIMRNKRQRSVQVAPGSFRIGALPRGAEVKIIHIDKDGDNEIEVVVETED